MTLGYTVPEIWRMTNVIIIFLGYFLPFYPPNSWKNENIKKNLKISSHDLLQKLHKIDFT